MTTNPKMMFPRSPCDQAQEQAIQNWLNGHRGHTRYAYVIYTNRFLEWMHSRQISLTHLTTEDLERYLEYLINPFGQQDPKGRALSAECGIDSSRQYKSAIRKMSPQSANYAMSIARLCLQWLTDCGCLARNPARDLFNPSRRLLNRQRIIPRLAPPSIPKAATIESLLHLLTQSAGSMTVESRKNRGQIRARLSAERDILIITMLYRMGLRRGEIALVRHTDVDLISDDDINAPGRVLRVPSPNGCSREVPIDHVAWRAMCRFHEVWESFTGRGKISPESHIVPSLHWRSKVGIDEVYGLPESMCYRRVHGIVRRAFLRVSEQMKDACSIPEYALVEKISPMQLRQVYAEASSVKHESYFSFQDALGHRSSASTERYARGRLRSTP